MELEQLLDDLMNPELSRYHQVARQEILAMYERSRVQPPPAVIDYKSVDEYCDSLGIWLSREDRKLRQKLGKDAVKYCSESQYKVITIGFDQYDKPIKHYPVVVLNGLVK